MNVVVSLLVHEVMQPYVKDIIPVVLELVAKTQVGICLIKKWLGESHETRVKLK